MKKHNFYVGIDLGTTNSSIGWGKLDAQNRLQVSLVEVNMLGEGNNFVRKELLPSAVYFKEDSAPVVGEYARFLYGRHSSRIVKSVKSMMGEKKQFSFNGQTYAPEDISALILKHLGQAARSFLGTFPEDVVITVPASFDSDMRQATLEAARSAGFKLTGEQGAPRNILLHEPVAALYDFINRQNRGEIPDTVVDFSQPRFVLVFDLGGGTLDVSLHQVEQDPGSGEVEIEDYAVSRYTRIGGDDFDLAVGRALLEEYRPKLQGLTLSPEQQAELESRFLHYAENVKIELSNQVNNRRMLGLPENEGIQAEIMQVPFDNKVFDRVITLEEYEQMVEPLLGNNLHLSSLQDLDRLDFSRENNIIYPVLDVLKKGEERLGRPVQVDAVLLNGGMTKLCTIVQRLEDLFGFAPITAGDPDKSVVRGAVAYHYSLHRGKMPRTIINDNVGIETEGGHVEHLVAAGTVLPHRSPVLKQFVVPRDGVNYLDIPFYMGRRRDTLPPNRRIADRRVRASKPFRAGEVVHIQVEVNEMAVISLKGWSQDDPTKEIGTEVSTTRAEPGSPNRQEAPKPGTSRAKPAGINAEPIQVGENVQHYFKLIRRYYKIKDPKQHGPAMNKIKEQEKKLLTAVNSAELVKPLLEEFRKVEDKRLKNRAIILLGNMAERHREHRMAVLQAAKELTDPLLLDYASTTEINTLWRYGVEAVGKTGLPVAESHLLSLAGKTKTQPIMPSILTSLGKTAASVNAVQHVKGHLTTTSIPVGTSALWALGKLGSREREQPLPLDVFQEAVHWTLSHLQAMRHVDLRSKAIYALGEICDRRKQESSVVDDQTAEKVLKKLRPYQDAPAKTLQELKMKQAFSRVAAVAIAMVEGRALNREEERCLLSIRANLASADQAS